MKLSILPSPRYFASYFTIPSGARPPCIQACIKTKFEDGTLSLDNNKSIEISPSKLFAVEEHLIRKLEHLEYLRLKKAKHMYTESRNQKKQEDANKSYNDFDWVGMFHKATLDSAKSVSLQVLPDPWKNKRSRESSDR